MIKIIFSLIFICFSFCYKADFSDKIDVYRNGKLIHSTEKFKGDFLYTNLFNIGDTITFHAETDWDELFNATIDIKSSEGILYKTLNRIKNNVYGAQFQLIITEKLLKEEFKLILNYNVESKIEHWTFFIMKKDE